MQRRQPLPRLWLMTDERQGETLWTALARLPRGAGVVFRHYRLTAAERRRLFDKVARLARRRRLILIVAGNGVLGRAWQSAGVHGGRRRGNGLLTRSAHNLAEVRAAERAAADIVFLSPVFATRSHPGVPALGLLRFALLARRTRIPVVALGGLDHAAARRLNGLGLLGWAAIDAWSEGSAAPRH